VSLALATATLAGALAVAPGAPAGAASLYGTVARISNLPNGLAPQHLGPNLSSEGRYVSYVAGQDAFRYDTVAKKTVTVDATAAGGAPNGRVLEAAISADGRYVVYASYATDVTSLPPVTTPAACLSATGANTCWLLYRYDASTQQTSLVTRVAGKAIEGKPENLSTSTDGRYVVYSTGTGMLPADSNGAEDVYRYDTRTGRTVLVSHASGGGPANQASRQGSVSADGNLVAFVSGATNIAPTGTGAHTAQVFLADVATGGTILVSHTTAGAGVGSTGGAADPAISADGSAVAFRGDGTGFGGAAGQQAVLRYDVAQGTTQRPPRFYDSVAGTKFSDEPSLSRDGRFLVYRLDVYPPGGGAEVDEIVRYDVARNASLVIRQYADPLAADGPRLSDDARHISFAEGGAGSTPPRQVFEWSAP
jgi:Tol biopolymer transport system component